MTTPLLVASLVTAVAAAARGMWSPCGLSMLSSLNPVSETARGHRFWATASWYVAGAVAGGALLGAGCAVAAFGVRRLGADPAWTWGLALVAAAIAVVSDSTLVARALPVHPRQVDERWLVNYRRWIYAGGYGVQIGTGFATYIMSAAVYLTATLAVLSASPGAALTVGIVFGLARGCAVLATARVRTADELRGLIAGIDRLGPASLRLACAVSAGVGVLAAWQLGGPVVAAAAAVPLGVLAIGRRTSRVAVPV